MAKPKKETTITVADMKKAIWEKEPGAFCWNDHALWAIDTRYTPCKCFRLAEGATPDEAWRNAYDALFGGKK